MKHIYFPPEWHKQSVIQLTWPHEHTDWNYMLEEINQCFVKIAQEILSRQKLLIVCRDAMLIKFMLGDCAQDNQNLILAEVPTNDTWARDHGAISLFVNDRPSICDFTFNGWGLKFAANFDNQINRLLYSKKTFSGNVDYLNKKDFVLEGGAIESDGKGTLLTTSECLLSPNRNPNLTKTQIEDYLKENLGLQRILWLDHGYLAGDDTDSHIDTLARFCDEHTIAYLKCDDESDEHYEALLKMEKQLNTFVDYEGNPYKLLPLPMARTIQDEDGCRLPATYANFLIMNEVVIVPIYDNNVKANNTALAQLQEAFPTKEIISINCTPIIKQHGSLHCVTMQYPEGFINL